ncbi:MAG: aminotransferase class V-fold PLP-dependent enzyme [Thermodesulfobacteriota bacterium]
MIYLDNAATSYPKPEPVYRRVDEVLRHVGGNPGRGSHRMALSAGRVIFEVRESIARLLNIKDSGRVAFTKNATESINLALKGLLKSGDHVVTTAVEHNAVVNTIKGLEKKGIKATMVGMGENGTIGPKEIDDAVGKNTRLVCITHASNVLGTILPVGDVGTICRRKGVPLMVDAAQTVGAVPIDVETMNIDILAGTGHKALFGPQGTGFLYIREGIDIPPLIDGGTGEVRESIDIPERLESGTINTPGISGLGAGVEFLMKEGVVRVREYEENLIGHIIDELNGIKGISIIGTLDASKRVSLVSFNIADRDPGEIGYLLDNEFGIMTRSGLHCAPSAHRAAGTYPGGAVRVSPGYFNSSSDIEEFIGVVRKIAVRV